MEYMPIMPTKEELEWLAKVEREVAEFLSQRAELQRSEVRKKTECRASEVRSQGSATRGKPAGEFWWNK